MSSPVDLRFEYRDSAGVHAVKEFHLEPASYIVTFRATVTEGDKRAHAGDRLGPGGRRRRRGQPLRQEGRRAAVPGRQGRRGSRRRTSRSSRRYDGDFEYAGVDDNYFMTAALFARREQGHVSAGLDSAARRTRRTPRASWWRTRSSRSGPTRRSSSSSGRRTSTSSARSTATSARAINFGMFAVIVVPLLRVAEVDQRLRRQLRLVDHHPDDHHQRRSCSRCGTRASCRCGRCRRFSRRSRRSRIATRS